MSIAQKTNSYENYNVTRLNSQSLYNDIYTFINKFESSKTSVSYERSIIRFAKFMFDKTISQLTESDLSQIRNADMLAYQKYLQNHPSDLANITINNYISPIQTLYRYLETNQYQVKSVFLKIDQLSEGDVKGYGMLHLHEAKEIEKLILAEGTKKSFEKYVYTRCSYLLGFRKDSLLNLKYTDIEEVYNEPGYYSAKTIGKGAKPHKVFFNQDLYDELMELKSKTNYENNRIFKLSKTTIQDIVNDIFPQVIPNRKERNVVWHSFRQTLGEFMSLEELKGFLNHSNINTTMRYRSKLQNPKEAANLRAENQIDDSVLEKLSKEELIKIIMKQSEGVLYGIKKEALDIVEER